LFFCKYLAGVNILNMRLSNLSVDRETAIELRRQAVLIDGLNPESSDWLERSWRRCLDSGHKPENEAVFQAVSHSKIKGTLEEHHDLIVAAQPVMQQLAKSIANTQYFAILTDRYGQVLNAEGAFDKHDKRASQITAIGVDLSEQAIGTTAICTALTEQKPVWLHRGEHFLSSNNIYSCAGAPIFGTQNECIGMLDLTGYDVPERRELVRLAARSAKDIQNAVLNREAEASKGAKILYLQWLGTAFDTASVGMIAFNDEGITTGFNRAALDWLPDLAIQKNQHCEALFSVSSDEFFACLHGGKTAVLPLWSGIQVIARWKNAAPELNESNLRNVEAELVYRAITAARGNVAIAAQKLGISRATLYRKLHKPPKS
jgi:sigma-54 dependent transcriptional regulator, acetoin dehydrogenase operon transcriptional activator AcoR